MRSRIASKSFLSILFGVLYVYSLAPTAHAETAAVLSSVTVYTATKTVTFCGSGKGCRGGGYSPDEVEILPDPNSDVQVIGAWVVPLGTNSISEMSDFHAMAYPSPDKNSAAVVIFLHPGVTNSDLFDYTVVIKYLKRATPTSPQ